VVGAGWRPRCWARPLAWTAYSGNGLAAVWGGSTWRDSHFPCCSSSPVLGYFVGFLSFGNGTRPCKFPGVVLAKSGLYLACVRRGAVLRQGPQCGEWVGKLPGVSRVEFAALAHPA